MKLIGEVIWKLNLSTLSREHTITARYVEKQAVPAFELSNDILSTLLNEMFIS